MIGPYKDMAQIMLSKVSVHRDLWFQRVHLYDRVYAKAQNCGISIILENNAA